MRKKLVPVVILVVFALSVSVYGDTMSNSNTKLEKNRVDRFLQENDFDTVQQGEFVVYHCKDRNTKYVHSIKADNSKTVRDCDKIIAAYLSGHTKVSKTEKSVDINGDKYKLLITYFDEPLIKYPYSYRYMLHNNQEYVTQLYGKLIKGQIVYSDILRATDMYR